MWRAKRSVQVGGAANLSSDSHKTFQLIVVIDLAMPGALGGQGKNTNPEELFAAGYGACFQSAMAAVAPEFKVKIPLGKEESIVESTVHLVGSLKELDLGLRVDLKVKVKGIDQATLEKLVKRTEEVCPYSRATKGNVVTNVEVEAI